MSEPLQAIVALFGQPVAGNPTQYMLEKAFAQAGLDWRYLTLEVAPENLADAFRGFRAMGFRGANLTIPHKVAAIPLLDELSDAARRIGAVNCVTRVGDKLRGENADGKGFLRSLKEIVDPAGKQIVILGAGGAARAIAVEIGLNKPAKITLVNRTPDRAGPLVDLIQQELGVPAEFVPWQGEYEIPAQADVVVNATSIGMGNASGNPAGVPARVPVSFAQAKPELVAADVIFSPANTRFLQTARDHGCRTLDGLGMLVNQGVICFEIWTGLTPDAALMREALEEFLSV